MKAGAPFLALAGVLLARAAPLLETDHGGADAGYDDGARGGNATSSDDPGFYQGGLLDICIHKNLRDCKPFEVGDYQCVNLEGRYDNSASSYAVYTCCCAFYDRPGCSPDDRMFRAYMRSDKKLRKQDNDRISSFQCVRYANCAGVCSGASSKHAGRAVADLRHSKVSRADLAMASA